jgi:solute carrier family 25 (adenine nucleotide translocator) protein 4/5/6/31
LEVQRNKHDSLRSYSSIENFAFKDAFKGGIFSSEMEEGYWMWFASNLVSGGAAGAASLCFVYSLDYSRKTLASDTKKAGERTYTGLIDVYVKTIKTDGLGALYHGFVVSCVGIAIYRGFYFGLYDTIKPSLPASIRNNFFANFAVGYGVTVVAGILSYPIDTIRHRLMMMTSGSRTHFKSSIDCAIQVIKAEGFMSMFKGARANVLRASIAGAGAISGFDIVKRHYEIWKFSDVGAYSRVS